MKYLYASKSFVYTKIAGLAWKNNGNEIKWSRFYIYSDKARIMRNACISE